MKQKKKGFIKLVLFLILLLAFTTKVQASDLFDKVTTRSTNVFSIQTLGASVEYFAYDDNPNGTITITGYAGYDGNSENLEIPSQYLGYTVTAIVDAAFKDKTIIEVVTIPSEVLTIGNNAFSGCTNLKKVIIDKHEHNEFCYHSHNSDCLHKHDDSCYMIIDCPYCEGGTTEEECDGTIYWDWAYDNVYSGSCDKCDFTDIVTYEKTGMEDCTNVIQTNCSNCNQDGTNFTGETYDYFCGKEEIDIDCGLEEHDECTGRIIGENAFEVSNNLKIYGYRDSAAHEYAIDNNIDFVILDDEIFTITFKDGENEIAIISDKYRTAINPPEEPTKEGYTFVGWDKEVPEKMPAENMEITAQWEINKYKVTFEDEDGTVLKEEIEYEYGIKAEDIVKPANPTKEADAQYTYTFAGWTPEISEVTGDVTYVATYTKTINKYTVTWVNEDGTVLKESTEYEYGAMPIYDGETPTKEANVQYTYTFAGWSPKVLEVTGDVIYTATYTSTTNKYTVTFYDEDGETLLGTSEVEYGTLPSYNGEGPKKEGTAEYTYTFAGWSPEISVVTGDVIYTATYTSTTNKYTVTFYDEDGETVLGTSIVEYGNNTTYNGEEPTKAATAQYTYTFAGWDEPEKLNNVTENRTVKATYTKTVNTYTVTWINEDGTVLETDENVVYGALPEYNGETPTKAATAQYTYTYKSWDKEIVEVTGDVIYTATYAKTVSTYTVIWQNEDETVLETDEEVPYGTLPSYDGEEPTKEPIAEHIYIFAGWNPAVSEVTGDITYTATYTDILSFSLEGIKYEVIDKVYNYVKIIGFDNNIKEDLIIPEKVVLNGKTYFVTEMEENAFSGCSTIKTVEIISKAHECIDCMHDFEIDGVTKIPSGAFSNCSNLTSVIIPKGVITIGDNAFSGCTNLIKVLIDEHEHTDECVHYHSEECYHVHTNDCYHFNHDSSCEQLVDCPNCNDGYIKTECDGTVYWGWVEDNKYSGFCDKCDFSDIVYYEKTGMVECTNTIQINCPNCNPEGVPNPNPGQIYDYVCGYFPGQLVCDKEIDCGKSEGEYTECKRTIGDDVFEGCNEDLTIYGYSNTVVETYANNYSIHFVPLDVDFTITFDTVGGSEIAEISAKYGTAVTAPADPIKEGYTFKGWDKEIPETMPAENITITAIWEVRSDLTYIVNYIDKDTNEIIDFKTVESQLYGAEIEAQKEIIEISEYIYDSVSADKIVIGLDGNIINIYYVKDQVEKIEARWLNAKEYEAGDKIDKSEIEVIAKYKSGNEKNITDYKIEPDGELTVQNKQVKITYIEGNITKEATLEIKVNPASGEKNPVYKEQLEEIQKGQEDEIKELENHIGKEIAFIKEIIYFEGLKLNDVKLPENWSWKEPDTSLYANTYVYEAIYDNGDENYKTLETMIVVKVLKANPKYELPQEIEAEKGTSLGELVDKLPKGYEFMDSSDTKVGEPGYRGFELRYIPEDTANYNIVENIAVIIHVVESNIPITDITVTSNLKILEGGRAKLTVNLIPPEVMKQELVWQSTDESVVTVDKLGNIVAKKAGKATIIVKTTDGEHEAKCEVEVVKMVYNVNQEGEQIYISEINPNTTKEIFEEKFPTLYDIEIYNKQGQRIDETNGELIGTGYTMSLYEGDKLKEEGIKLVVKGDITGEGKADWEDSTAIIRHRLEIEKLEEIYEKAADINKDGIVDGRDSTMLIYHRLQLKDYKWEN